MDGAARVENPDQATADQQSRFKKSERRRRDGHPLDGALDNRQEPLATDAPRGLAGGEGHIVAGVLPQLVDDPVGQVHRRVEEKHGLHHPLDDDHPEIAAADVGQLVQEDPGQLLGRQAVAQVGGKDHDRPHQAADGGRVEIEVDSPAHRNPQSDCALECRDVDRQRIRAKRFGLAHHPARRHHRPEEPRQEQNDEENPTEHEPGLDRERGPYGGTGRMAR